MTSAVKIKTLSTPDGDLSEFDPGAYLSSLEFFETDAAITDTDRDGLAQFVHLLAFIALSNKSPNWPSSVISRHASAYRALESHFSHLPGWSDVTEEEGIPYRSLASLLLKPFPPRRP